MKAGMAILTSLGIIVVWILVGSIIHPALGWAIFLGTSIWAGVDASKIELKKYKVGGPTSSAVTVIGCLLLWIVVFPWYLVNKGKIERGEAPLKDGYVGQDEGASTTPVNTQSLGNSLAQLEKLAQLKEKGVLSDEEFQTQKAKLLS